MEGLIKEAGIRSMHTLDGVYYCLGTGELTLHNDSAFATDFMGRHEPYSRVLSYKGNFSPENYDDWLALYNATDGLEEPMLAVCIGLRIKVAVVDRIGPSVILESTGAPW